MKATYVDLWPQQAHTHERAHIHTAHNTQKEEEQTQEECGLQYLSRLDISKDYPVWRENTSNKGQFSSSHEHNFFPSFSHSTDIQVPMMDKCQRSFQLPIGSLQADNEAERKLSAVMTKTGTDRATQSAREHGRGDVRL